MTVFNRYNRWRRKGIWQQIAEVLARDPALSSIASYGGFPRITPAEGGSRLLDIREAAQVRAGQSDGLSAPEGLELTLQLLAMLECVAFYAAGSIDAGARAKAVIKAFKAPPHLHGYGEVFAAASSTASDQHPVDRGSRRHFNAAQEQSEPQTAHWPRRGLQEPA